MYPPRGDSARTGRILGRHKNGKYAAVTRGRPAFQQHESRAEGSDTPHTWKYRKNVKWEFLSPSPTELPPKPSEAVSVGRRRCSGVSEFSSAAATETSDMQLVPPKPSEAVSVGRGRATERASPAACGGTRDSSSARTTASIAFVWSAAKPLPCQTHWAGHGPTPPSCGQKPTPTQSCERFCGNAFTRLRRRSFKGGPVPL